MPTANNNLPVRQYIPQYSQILSTVFGVQAAFGGAFSPLQTKDGIQFNSKAFSVKTNATPVVVGTYSKDTNTAFGTGTAKSSRFGDMTEVIYADTDANYSYELAIHEGLDRHTVNNDLNAAVADRLNLQSQAQVRAMNKRNGAFLATNAGNAAEYAGDVAVLFNELHKYYINKEVTAPVTAYVTSDLYTAVVDYAANTSAKGSTVSLDDNGVKQYKGFSLIEVAEANFPDGVIALFAPDMIAIPFVGIETARTIEATNFDGVELQATSKGGQFILDDNKVAVTKVTVAAEGPAEG
ncbi:phage capsid protein [Periweissella cryptocerci]|uniref:Phage capsid protein n=1 Tax=Periweissella cryptocerci TaxID=2506420 RepID=A0A4P6YW53_9LACO|nr:phage capsid protein [Periweissella cryptocerci]QBO36967.1 phage capsid protein [Periweissella cryptocerci]